RPVPLRRAGHPREHRIAEKVADGRDRPAMTEKSRATTRTLGRTPKSEAGQEPSTSSRLRSLGLVGAALLPAGGLLVRPGPRAALVVRRRSLVVSHSRTSLSSRRRSAGSRR